MIDHPTPKTWQQVTIDDLHDALEHVYKLSAYLEITSHLADTAISDTPTCEGQHIANSLYWLTRDGSDKCTALMNALDKIRQDIEAQQPKPLE